MDEEIKDCVGKIHCETLADCHSFNCPHWGHEMVGIKMRDHLALMIIVAILLAIQLSQLFLSGKKDQWIERANEALTEDRSRVLINQEAILRNQEKIIEQTKVK